MRFAILGDIHANWEAFSCVLTDARNAGVDAYACVGDIVGYNADPRRCIEMIMEIGCPLVQGNHDYYCVHPIGRADVSPLAAAALNWTRAQLDEKHLKILASLPRTTQCYGFTLVHNTLDDTENWSYVFDAQDAERSFLHQATPLCFHGHTHLPALFERREGKVRLRRDHRLELAEHVSYFVNVGSVGQPRDRDPRAAYVLYDDEARTLELRRVAYDISRTQLKIVEAGLPDVLALRLSFGF